MDNFADSRRQASQPHPPGDWDQAEQSYRATLDRDPHRFEVRRDLAWLLWQRGRRSEASEELQRCLSDAPTQAVLHNDLGMILRSAGELDRSIASFQKALELEPALWQARFNLGNAYQQQGQFGQAVAAYTEVLRYVPDDADVYLNRGASYRKQGQAEAAKFDLQQALALRPSAAAWFNLGLVEQAVGAVPEAVNCFQLASQLNPASAQPHFHRGVALRSWNNAAAAIGAFRDALQLDPRHAEACRQLAETYASAGYAEQAIDTFHEARRLTGDDAFRLRAAATLPIIIESERQIADTRSRLRGELDSLGRATLRIQNPFAIGTPLFPLAYHGHDERATQTLFASIVRKGALQLSFTAPHCADGRQRAPSGRIKLGFVSLNLGDHTIGKLNAGLIENIDRRLFEVLVFGADRSHDTLGRRIAARADRFVALENDWPTARAQISREEMDVLFYTDIGLEPMSYCLAHARLAPVQCVTWGHPLTTGISTLDYFISSADLEPAGSESHYSEALVRLSAVAVHYFRPPPTASRRTPADFGLDPRAHWYACLQSPFKLHPDDDQTWAEILRRDTAGRLLLLEGQFPEWHERLYARFQRSIPDVASRIQFVAQQAPHEFVRLLELVDVLLDPLHFGGGETSYQSFAVGTPVVTLPGGFLRSRITYALYRAMGVTDCVVESRNAFVARAVQLGTSRETRAQVREKILAAAGAIFESNAGVRELESFLIEALARAGR